MPGKKEKRMQVEIIKHRRPDSRRAGVSKGAYTVTVDGKETAQIVQTCGLWKLDILVLLHGGLVYRSLTDNHRVLKAAKAIALNLDWTSPLKDTWGEFHDPANLLDPWSRDVQIQSGQRII
jgi:hypothetical protein